MIGVGDPKLSAGSGCLIRFRVGGPGTLVIWYWHCFQLCYIPKTSVMAGKFTSYKGITVTTVR